MKTTPKSNQNLKLHSTKIVFPKEDRIERVENVKDPKLYIERLDQLIQRKEQFLLAKSDTDAKIDVYNR